MIEGKKYEEKVARERIHNTRQVGTEKMKRQRIRVGLKNEEADM